MSGKYEYLFVIAGLATILLCVGAYVLNAVNSLDVAGLLF